MGLSPKILDAMRGYCTAMGFAFDPSQLPRVTSDGLDAIGLATAMGLPPQETARLLIEKFTAADIERGLPNCVRQLDGGATYISVPLDDLRFAHGYIALVEAGAQISLDQTKRATQIAHELSLVTGPARPKAPTRKTSASRSR